MQFSSIAFSALNSAAYIHSTIIKQTRTTFYRDADGLRGCGCCFVLAVSSMNDNQGVVWLWETSEA